MSKETDLNESNEDLKVDQTEAETNVARIIAAESTLLQNWSKFIATKLTSNATTAHKSDD